MPLIRAGSKSASGALRAGLARSLLLGVRRRLGRLLGRGGGIVVPVELGPIERITEHLVVGDLLLLAQNARDLLHDLSVHLIVHVLEFLPPLFHVGLELGVLHFLLERLADERLASRSTITRPAAPAMTAAPLPSDRKSVV